MLSANGEVGRVQFERVRQLLQRKTGVQETVPIIKFVRQGLKDIHLLEVIQERLGLIMRGNNRVRITQNIIAVWSFSVGKALQNLKNITTSAAVMTKLIPKLARSQFHMSTKPYGK